jgi:hypothetical protein
MFILYYADTMTEPILALVYVLALRLHHFRQVEAGMIVTSLIIMARPEGFFLCLLWGICVLAEAKPADDKKLSLSFLCFGTTFAIPVVVAAEQDSDEVISSFNKY